MELLWAIVEVARTAGPFGAVYATVMWWLERKERQAIAEKSEADKERVVIGLYQASEAVKQSTALLQDLARRQQ